MKRLAILLPLALAVAPALAETPATRSPAVPANEPMVVETIRLEHETADKIATALGNLCSDFCEVTADKRDRDGKLLLYRGPKGNLPAVREIVSRLDVDHPEIRFAALILKIGSPTNRETALAWFDRAILGIEPQPGPESFTNGGAFVVYRGTRDAAFATAVSNENAKILGMPLFVARDGDTSEISHLDVVDEPGQPAFTNGVSISVQPFVPRDETASRLTLTVGASVHSGGDSSTMQDMIVGVRRGEAAVFVPPPAGDCHVLFFLFPDDSAFRLSPEPLSPEPPSGPVVEKMRRIVLPEVEFYRARLADVFSFLCDASAEFDEPGVAPAERGVNFVIDVPAERIDDIPRITIRAKPVSVLAVLDIIARTTDLEWHVDGKIVRIGLPSPTDPATNAPAPHADSAEGAKEPAP